MQSLTQHNLCDGPLDANVHSPTPMIIIQKRLMLDHQTFMRTPVQSFKHMLCVIHTNRSTCL